MSLCQEEINLIYQHWANKFQFNSKIFYNESDCSILKSHHPESRINILKFGQTKIILLNEDIFDEFEDHCSKNVLAFNENGLESFLETYKLNPPDLLMYLSSDDFLKKKLGSEYEVRALKPDDRNLLEEMKSECSNEDVEAAYITLEDDIILGAFKDRKLIGAANAYFYKNDSKLADIMVLTHPGHRRKGIAQGVLSELCKKILDKGKIPQYRVHPHLINSVKLAKSLGFEIIGEWIPEYQS